jgi:hypothetical protein
MPQWIEETINWWISGWLGLLLYWVPMALCVIGYMLDALHLARQDRINRSNGGDRFGA